MSCCYIATLPCYHVVTFVLLPCRYVYVSSQRLARDGRVWEDMVSRSRRWGGLMGWNDRFCRCCFSALLVTGCWSSGMPFRMGVGFCSLIGWLVGPYSTLCPPSSLQEQPLRFPSKLIISPMQHSRTLCEFLATWIYIYPGHSWIFLSLIFFCCLLFYFDGARTLGYLCTFRKERLCLWKDSSSRDEGFGWLSVSYCLLIWLTPDII